MPIKPHLDAPINARVLSALGWLACVLMLGLALLVSWPKGALSTDVLELLPEVEGDAQTVMLTDAAVGSVANRVVWAVSGSEAAANAMMAGLTSAGLVTTIEGHFTPDDQAAWLKDVRQSVLGSLPETVISDLTEEKGKHQLRQIMAQLYSPVGGVTGEEWANDPFLLTRSVMTAGVGTAIGMKGGWLTAQDQAGTTWHLMTGVIPEDAKSGAGLNAWIAKEKALRASIAEKFDAKIVGQGVVFYSHHAASQAERDVTRLGSLSIGLLALFIGWTFRSVRPVVLCLVSVSVGALCGTAATLWLFGSLHAVTLVMCLSLIGISADYTTYYLVRRRWAGHDEMPWQSLVALRPSLWHALITTCVAYGLMLAAPFPGLRQLAVFAVCGLVGAWLTVVLWFPFLVHGFPVRPLQTHTLLTQYVSAWAQRAPWTRVSLAGLVVVIGVGLTQLKVNDDLGALQTTPEQLMQEERLLSELLGKGFSQTWFAVTGHTLNASLDRLKALRPTLATLETEGVIEKPVVVPFHSEVQQTMVFNALQGLEGTLVQRLNPPCAKRQDQSSQTKGCVPYDVVTPEAWLASRAGAPYRTLIRTLPDGQVAVFVPVTMSQMPGAHDRASEAVALLDETYWLHRRADFGTRFATFREGLTILIGVGFAALTGMLMRLLGVRRGLCASLPVMGGLLAGLAATGLLGMPVNLFSLFALILVMGIGVDYTVFFQSGSAASEKLFYAMSVALTTTLLSLGILVFSETPAVRVFGCVLSVGVLVAFLLAPAAGVPLRKESKS